MRSNFGAWGGHVELFDIYEDWAAERRGLVEAGINPLTGEQSDRQLLEGSPEGKADFASFLYGPVISNALAGYERVQSQFRRFTGKTTVNSFDEVRLKGFNGLTGMGYIGDLGTYPGARRSFRPEAAIIVDIYGVEYRMSRKLLRSAGIDQLVRDNPVALGEMVADFIANTVVALIVANPNAPDGAPMYSTGRGNSVSVALSEDTLVDAAVWLRTRRDADGRPIRANIRAAVVQNDRVALRLRQIINSQLTGLVVNDPANSSMVRGNMNPIAGSDLIPTDGIIIDPYMPDANDVYFFADADRMPAFTVAYLDGQETPMIGLKSPEVQVLMGGGSDPYTFSEDTLDWKARIDFGATAVEPLATYRLTPA